MSKVNISDTLKELYRIFYQLEKELFDKPLEEPVILIQSRKKKVLGTCTVSKVWENKNNEKDTKYEITITAESLNRSTNEIVETLLHEMVHLYCSLNDIKDTSNNYVYHNKKYKEYAEKFGLEVTHAKTVGLGVTKLKPNTEELIKKFNINEEVFNYYRNSFSLFSDKKKTIYNKYSCPNCNIKLSSYKKLNLICGDCKVPLKERI